MTGLGINESMNSTKFGLKGKFGKKKVDDRTKISKAMRGTANEKDYKESLGASEL